MPATVVKLDDLQNLVGHYFYILTTNESGQEVGKIIGPLKTYDVDQEEGIVYFNQDISFPDALLLDKETNELPEILYESEYLWRVQFFKEYTENRRI